MQQNVENTTTTLVVKITICHNKSKRFSWFTKNACLVQGLNQIITQLLSLDDESICVKTDRYSKTDRQIVFRFVSQAGQIIRLEDVLMCSINDSKQFRLAQFHLFKIYINNRHSKSSFQTQGSITQTELEDLLSTNNNANALCHECSYIIVYQHWTTYLARTSTICNDLYDLPNGMVQKIGCKSMLKRKNIPTALVYFCLWT